MRRGPIAGILAAALCAVALACGDFGPEDPVASSGSGDAATASSTSGAPRVDPGSDGDANAPPVGEAGSTTEPVDAGDCHDFATDRFEGFDVAGEAPTTTPDGLRIVVDEDGTTVKKKFHLDADIKASQIGLDLKLEVEGGDGAFEADEFADLLTLEYGDGPHTSFELLDNHEVDVDIWASKGDSPYESHTFSGAKVPFKSLGELVWITSTWSKVGSHAITSSLGNASVAGNTSNDTPKKDLTVIIGGKRGKDGEPPAVTITLRRLCVLLK